MNPKTLTNIYWFCQAVAHGGFASASSHHRASAPTLSRAVSQLEKDVGEKLVHRNAKKFQLTKAGEDCYQRFSPLVQSFGEQWLQLPNNQRELAGDIHIAYTEPFAELFLQKIPIDFMKNHPLVNVHIHFANDAERFYDDQIDLAIVINRSKVGDFVQKRLFDLHLSLGATPEYLSQYGTPKTVNELQNHRLIAVNNLWLNSLSVHENLVESADDVAVNIDLTATYSINSLRMDLKACQESVGLCLMPSLLLDNLVKNNQLVEVLPKAIFPAPTAYMVRSDRQLLSARVTALRDEIVKAVAIPEPFLVGF